jgi:hypothetical protein
MSDIADRTEFIRIDGRTTVGTVRDDGTVSYLDEFLQQQVTTVDQLEAVFLDRRQGGDRRADYATRWGVDRRKG